MKTQLITLSVALGVFAGIHRPDRLGRRLQAVDRLAGAFSARQRIESTGKPNRFWKGGAATMKTRLINVFLALGVLAASLAPIASAGGGHP